MVTLCIMQVSAAVTHCAIGRFETILIYNRRGWSEWSYIFDNIAVKLYYFGLLIFIQRKSHHSWSMREKWHCTSCARGLLNTSKLSMLCGSTVLHYCSCIWTEAFCSELMLFLKQKLSCCRKTMWHFLLESLSQATTVQSSAVVEVKFAVLSTTCNICIWLTNKKNDNRAWDKNYYKNGKVLL